MNKKILVGLLAALMVLPAALANVNPSTPDVPPGAVPERIAFESKAAMEAWIEQFEAAEAAKLDVPADFTLENAADVLIRLHAGEEVNPLLIVHTAKFLRTVDDADAAAASVLAIERLVLSALEPVQTDTVPNQGQFDSLAATRAGAEAAVVPAAPDALKAYYGPHNARSLASYYASVTSQYVPYCDSWNCLVYYTLDADFLSAAAFDHAGLTDSVVAQTATSVTTYYGYNCWYQVYNDWWWSWVQWYCNSFSGGYSNDKVLATNVQHTFAYPAEAGVFATRGTGQDVIQSAYDRMGKLYSQKPREWTSASNTPAVPENPAGVTNVVNVPGAMTPPVSAGPVNLAPAAVGGMSLDTRMGLGDVGTASPPVNYYGVQRSTTVPSCTSAPAPAACVPPAYPQAPGLPVAPPATPPTPVTAPDGKMYYDGVHVKDRKDYKMEADANGVTAVDQASVLRTFQPNFLVVRWHNTGAGTASQGTVVTPPVSAGPVNADPTGVDPATYQAPAEYLYEVGSYFTGGAGVRVKAVYGLVDSLRLQ